MSNSINRHTSPRFDLSLVGAPGKEVILDFISFFSNRHCAISWNRVLICQLIIFSEHTTASSNKQPERDHPLEDCDSQVFVLYIGKKEREKAQLI